MFDAEYFKDLLNETTALMANKAECSGADADEIQVRIESNVAALKYLARDIADAALQKKTLERIDLLCLDSKDFEVSTLQSRGRALDIKKTDEHSDRIERDILRYSKGLHGKAKRLLESLELDSNVMDETADRMSRNVLGTSTALKSLQDSSSYVSAFKMIVTTLIIFVAMYFVIRFM